MPITTGFIHITMLTTDIERHAEFYRQVFDAQVTLRVDPTVDRPRRFVLDMGTGSALDVLECSAADIAGDRRNQGRTGAIDHFGVSVGSFAALEQVKLRLVSVAADIGEIRRRADTWSLTFRDVDGIDVEVCSPLT